MAGSGCSRSGPDRHGFDWYSTDRPGARFDATVRDRAGLGHYFNRRPAAAEALRLMSFRFNGNSAAYGDFQYALIRRAKDQSPTSYVGKGAAACNQIPCTIGEWSMATES